MTYFCQKVEKNDSCELKMQTNITLIIVCEKNKNFVIYHWFIFCSLFIVYSLCYSITINDYAIV